MMADAIKMLQDTLKILEKGYYKVKGKIVPLALSDKEMREAERIFRKCLLREDADTTV